MLVLALLYKYYSWCSALRETYMTTLTHMHAPTLDLATMKLGNSLGVNSDASQVTAAELSEAVANCTQHCNFIYLLAYSLTHSLTHSLTDVAPAYVRPFIVTLSQQRSCRVTHHKCVTYSC